MYNISEGYGAIVKKGASQQEIEITRQLFHSNIVKFISARCNQGVNILILEKYLLE